MSENWPSKEQEIWFQAGVTGERERIIKLLENEVIQIGKYSGTNCNLPIDPMCCQECYGTSEIIALIKGETNE